MNKFLTLLLITFTVMSSNVLAAKGDKPFGDNALFGTGTVAADAPSSVANSEVVLDFNFGGNIESWDGEGDTDNQIENCITGGSITGVGWDVTIETIGLSWLSEATMKFSNSTQDSDMLFLGVGAGEDTTGVMTFSSGGILDLTDNGIADIVPNADGLLQIEFFESFDDVADDIDSLLTGSITVAGIDLVGAPGPGCASLRPPPPVVPVNNSLALLLLVLSMLGFVAYRRFA